MSDTVNIGGTPVIPQTNGPISNGATVLIPTGSGTVTGTVVGGNVVRK